MRGRWRDRWQIYQQLIDPYLERIFPPSRCPKRWLQWKHSRGRVTSRCRQRTPMRRRMKSETLLSVLDAELSAEQSECTTGSGAEDRDSDFQRNLGIDSDVRRRAAGSAVRAAGGISAKKMIPARPRHRRGLLGQDCPERRARRFCRTWTPRTGSGRLLKGRAKALWGVPLSSKENVIGVLLIGFSEPHDWLPTE